jgi:hypothetical protein
MMSAEFANCSKTTVNDFCDFRNYLAGIAVFGQETKKATGFEKEKRHRVEGKNIKQPGNPHPISQTDELHKIWNN